MYKLSHISAHPNSHTLALTKDKSIPMEEMDERLAEKYSDSVKAVRVRVRVRV